MKEKLDLGKIETDEGSKVYKRKRKKKKKKKKKKILLRIVIFLCVLISIITATGFYLIRSGERKFYQAGGQSYPVLPSYSSISHQIQENQKIRSDTTISNENRRNSSKTERLEDDKECWEETTCEVEETSISVTKNLADQESITEREASKEDSERKSTVQYQGKTYEYNQDIINLLFIGMDTSKRTNSMRSAKGGEANMIFLAVLDSYHKRIHIIYLSGDIITNISAYDEHGDLVEEKTGHLAWASSYSENEQKSAELTKKAVSEFFYGLPIHGYCSLNFGALSYLNDAVDGVTIRLLDDFTAIDPSFIEGNEVHLMGDQADQYVLGSSGMGSGSRDTLMARQKQYFLAFARQVKNELKSNLSLPGDLYEIMKNYMVTDMTSDQVMYLFFEMMEESFEDDMFQTIQGERRQSGTETEFYADKRELYELMIDIFYVERKEND